jgi:signal transduction histidine kinase
VAIIRGAQVRVPFVGWSFLLVLAVVLELGLGLVLLLTGGAERPLGWLRWLADLHRLWAGRVMDRPIARPYRNTRTRREDPATWRDVRWLAADSTLGLVLAGLPALCVLLCLLGLALMIDARRVRQNYVFDGGRLITVVQSAPEKVALAGVLCIVFFFLIWLVTMPAMRAYTWLTHALLAPAETTKLAHRVAELTRSRADTVDAQAAEIRRIERDLHDGAQARLVSLGMSLGMAEKVFSDDPQAARKLLGEAKESTGLALSELRELVHGIHPPILADRGLDGAVRALALASALPIELNVHLPGRPPAPVESAVYFALTEVLANVGKHSGATGAWIRISHEDGRLCVMVGDDGRGGATMPPGGGLDGIERRLAAFDGTVIVASPFGGPTIVTMELSCDLVPVLS